MDTVALTTERGDSYGDPLHHFSASEGMYELWLRHFEQEREQLDLDKEQGTVHFERNLTDAEALAVRHVAKFVIDKLVRAARSPRKVDHWEDIAGYARTAKMAMRLDEEAVG